MPKDEKAEKKNEKIETTSAPIDKEKKEKKEKETNEKSASLESPPATLLSQTDVPVNANITAGTWVAEMENTNIRKNALRLGS